MGCFRGFILPWRDWTSFCSYLAHAATGQKRTGKQQVMVLVSYCRSGRGRQLRLLLFEYRRGECCRCGYADVLRTGICLSRLIRIEVGETDRVEVECNHCGDGGYRTAYSNL